MFSHRQEVQTKHYEDDKMIEYKLKNYVEPSVSYFDGMGDAGNMTTTPLATLVGIALIAAVATSARGSQNTLER